MNQHHDAEHRRRQEGRGFHKDWRVWTVVILILAAMASYILTFDERLRPAPPNPPAPASGPSR